MRGIRAAVLVVSLLAVSMTATGGSAHAASCAPGGAGGDWPSYGRNLSNTRHQDLETQIGVGNVADLEPAWSLEAASARGLGTFQSTPAISDGCVFIGTGLASVLAVNADTGGPVWTTQLLSLPGIGGIFAPSVADGRVHVLVGEPFLPYAAALDQQTGEILWVTLLNDVQHTGFTNASAVVHNGLFFAALAGRDILDPFTRPSFFILDAATGEILKQTRVIPDDQAFAGFPPSPYGGGGIWTTAVVDTETNYLYAGTANPYSKRLEHERTNSILKIDFDRSRTTFGEIVGNFKGDFDYIPSNYNSFECQTLGDAQPVAYGIFCGQQDVDFGASPNLYRLADGRTIVGDFQKSGTYHAVDTETMKAVWQARNLAPPSAGGNSATSAFDGASVYVASNQNRIHSLDKDTGAVRWTATYDDGVGGYKPLTVANGVIYTMAANGVLLAVDASTGALLFRSASCGTAQGAGVAVARNTVYASCDTGTILAYR